MASSTDAKYAQQATQTLRNDPTFMGLWNRARSLAGPAGMSQTEMAAAKAANGGKKIKLSIGQFYGLDNKADQEQLRDVRKAYAQRAAALGITLPHDYGIGRDGSDALPTVERAGYLDRNIDWIGPLIAGAAIGGPFVAGALAGSGGAAAASGGSAGATVAGGAAGTAAGVGAGTAAGAATGATTAASTAGWWGPLLEYGVPAAMSLAGAKMQTNAANKSAALQTSSANYAADINAKAMAEALAVEKEQLAFDRAQLAEQQRLAAEKLQYDRAQVEMQRQARAPYVSMSNNAFSKLADLLGVQAPNFQGPPPSGMPPPPPQQAPQASMPPPSAPAAPQGGTNLASVLGQSGGRAPVYPSAQQAMTPADNLAGAAQAQPDAPTIRMQAPTGEIKDVPRAQMNHFLSRGARVVGV